MHSETAILLILGHFIIIVIALTILWRIAISLDSIAKSLLEMGKELKKLTSDKKE